MNQYPRIRDLREDADLTQAQVGERLGLSQRTYAYYESGQRMVPPEVLCALGDLYGVSVDYLLGRTDRREMNRLKDGSVGNLHAAVFLYAEPRTTTVRAGLPQYPTPRTSP